MLPWRRPQELLYVAGKESMMMQENKTILDEQQREYQSVSSDDRQKLAPELRPHAQSGIMSSIGWILQIGVSLSAVIILLGIVLLPTWPGGLSPERVLAFPQHSARLLLDCLCCVHRPLLRWDFCS